MRSDRATQLAQLKHESFVMRARCVVAHFVTRARCFVAHSLDADEHEEHPQDGDADIRLYPQDGDADVRLYPQDGDADVRLCRQIGNIEWGRWNLGSWLKGCKTGHSRVPAELKVRVDAVIAKLRRPADPSFDIKLGAATRWSTENPGKRVQRKDAIYTDFDDAWAIGGWLGHVKDRQAWGNKEAEFKALCERVSYGTGTRFEQRFIPVENWLRENEGTRERLTGAMELPLTPAVDLPVGGAARAISCYSSLSNG
ncbi:hypothetical protein T492DRAFT_231538 [Pavlovales sp. CCMP2436]|nr:hypothetical protein T492DRAFT_231538 [Pavlovales sp. CCMP2436]